MKKLPKIGCYVKRGEKGIWQLTNIIKRNDETRYYYGGIYDIDFDWENIIPKNKIYKLLKLTKFFKKGDFVIASKESKKVFGFIVDIFPLSYERKIWIQNYHGYISSVDDGTAVKLIFKYFPSPKKIIYSKDILGF